MSNNLIEIYKNLEFEEAVSHRIHSRIFEILGYLGIIDTSRLAEEDQEYLSRVEDLSKSLITELHSIIDYYKMRNS